MTAQQRARAADQWRESRGELMTEEEAAIWEAIGEWIRMEADTPAGIGLGEEPLRESTARELIQGLAETRMALQPPRHVA